MRKKLFVFAALLTFAACSNQEELDEKVIVENKNPLTRTISDTKIVDETLMGYSDLGIIPDSAKAKMDNHEYELWNKIGQKMYINYSFLDEFFYKENKQSIMAEMDYYYQDFLCKTDTVFYLFFAELQKASQHIKRKVTRDEGSSDGSYIGTADVWSISYPKSASLSVGVSGVKNNGVLSVTYVGYTCHPFGDFVEVGTNNILYVDGITNNVSVHANGYFVILNDFYYINKYVNVHLYKNPFNY